MKKTFGGPSIFLDRGDINTDEIIPAKYLTEVTKEALTPYILEDLMLEGFDPKGEKLKNASVVVSRENFGCGSSREHAAIALKAVGTSVILAQSFARIFYRNAINLGLPLLVSPGITDHVTTGDQLKIDLKEGVVYNQLTGAELKVQQMSGYVFEILESGGIKPLVKKQLAQIS